MASSNALKLECTLRKLQEDCIKDTDYIFKSSCIQNFICTDTYFLGGLGMGFIMRSYIKL